MLAWLIVRAILYPQIFDNKILKFQRSKFKDHIVVQIGTINTKIGTLNTEIGTIILLTIANTGESEKEVFKNAF